MIAIIAALVVRCLMVALFLPFSALDKLLNYDAAVGQASAATPSEPIAKVLIVGGFGIEVLMSTAVLTGVADRLAGVVLAGYCIATAILWKQFWKAPDFRLRGQSAGRDVLWDFLKNLSVAGGFFLLAVGSDASGLATLIRNPLASSHPYVASR